MTDNLDERLAEIMADIERMTDPTQAMTSLRRRLRPAVENLGARLRDALAEVEAARKDARVYQELYEQRVDTLVQVEAERDALAVRLAAAERKVRAVELLHVWTNDDGKRFVFADELAVALEIPGAEAVTDR